MTETNIIKSITIHTCPHCGKEVFVENQITPPVVSSLFTVEAIEKAKKECLKRIETTDIGDGKKEAIRKWLNDPNTIFGPDEVESIILSLLKPEK